MAVIPAPLMEAKSDIAADQRRDAERVAHLHQVDVQTFVAVITSFLRGGERDDDHAEGRHGDANGYWLRRALTGQS